MFVNSSVKQIIVLISLDFRGEVEVEDINIGDISVKVVFKYMGFEQISQEEDLES